MSRTLVGRLRAMSREEVSWRLRARIRTHAEEAVTVIRPPRWRREDVRRALAVDTLPEPLQAAVDAGDWLTVHRKLGDVLRSRPSRFIVNPAARRDLRRAVRSRWPDAEADALSRATAIVDGKFDLLGYRGLSFGSNPTGSVDWHFDPVHQRRMPMEFWSRVPYLDPACGDHKIVWELNRQQHWLTLSRALWLTGDEVYARHMVKDLGAWMSANPPLVGANWSSMLELAFRSLSWLWGLHAMLATQHLASGDEPWLVDMMVALDRQLSHVECNLSLYFSPNTHLTGEALALYVAGTALPELAGSTRWTDTGRRILLHEIDRQIEPDGGHVERSTHYHRYTLDFYLLALLTARRNGDVEAEARFGEALHRLAPFALAMADVNGLLPRFGDDDAGRLWPITARDSADIRDSLSVAAVMLDCPEWAPWGATEEALWLTSNDPLPFQRARGMSADDRRVRERRTLPFRIAERRGAQPRGTSRVLAFAASDRRRVDERRGRYPDRRRIVGQQPASSIDRRTTRVFPRTGYVTTATQAGDHLVLDAGPHGYLNGGHAHADALSVVLALRGKSLLVDPGTPTYTMDPELRDHLRSSVNHNTLTIDGRSSAVPQGPFHWQTRADASLDVVRHNARFALIEARHEAYGDVGHRRLVFASDGGYLFVDQVTGDGPHEAEQHWHIDPRWRVVCESSQRLRIVHESGDEAWMLSERGALWLVYGDEVSSLGWVSPEYGRRVPSWTVRVTHADAAPFTLVSWCGAAGWGDSPAIERLVCESDHEAAAVAVRVQQGRTEWMTMLRPGDATERPARRCTAGSFQTDGRAFQTRLTNGRVTSVCLADGTFARLAGEGLTVEADAFMPDLHVDRVGNQLDLSASAPPGRLRLHGAALAGIAGIVLNGRERRSAMVDDDVVLAASEWADPLSRANVQGRRNVRHRRVR